MIVVARRTSELGEVKVLRSRENGSHAYVQGSWYQSHADRRGVSLAGYIHALYGLILQTGAERVLVLGCAGGTLGTMLVRAGRQVTMVDIDPDAFVLARMFFRLAPEIDCHVGDGRAFLERTTTSFDAIVVDAFCRNALPSHLCSTEFFRLARRRLKPRGTILVNAVVAHDLDRIADMLAAGMAEAGLPTGILDIAGARDRNAIVLGGQVDPLERPRLLVATDAMGAELAAELDAMKFRDRRRAHPICDGDWPRRRVESGSLSYPVISQ
jgi:predicted membrane-bound spermidine synthase